MPVVGGRTPEMGTVELMIMTVTVQSAQSVVNEIGIVLMKLS